jgi:hypothetical protein
LIDISNIERFLSHPKVVETYNNFNALVSADFPAMNYIGINFDKTGVCSLKFYFAFYQRLTKEEVLKFIPHTADFDKYYHLWDASKKKSLGHTGCTFEIKFKGNLEPVLGFHFRLKPIKESYDLIGYPQHLPVAVGTLGTRPGINYEYSKDDVLRKKYYYLVQEDHKSYIAERFNKPFANNVQFAEYTESDLFSKVNLWRFDYSEENMNRPNYFRDSEQEMIDFFKRKYGLVNISEGYYENDEVKATYFFNTFETETFSKFDDPRNFQIDTLKLFF